MTLRDAYQQLQARWPGSTFNISVDVWHYAHHTPGKEIEITYSVWRGDTHEGFEGRTLQQAVDLAVGRSETMDDVEAALRVLPGGRT